jgi:hypothetical protein
MELVTRPKDGEDGDDYIAQEWRSFGKRWKLEALPVCETEMPAKAKLSATSGQEKTDEKDIKLGQFFDRRHLSRSGIG